MKMLACLFAVVLLLTTGPASVAESDGWRTICTTVPGKTYDYCKISRIVVHKLADGTKIRVRLVAEFPDRYTLERSSRITISVKGRRLTRTSIKLDAGNRAGYYSRTVQCKKNSCYFDRSLSSILMAAQFHISKTATVKLRMFNPLRIVVVKFPLKGFREEYKSTLE